MSYSCFCGNCSPSYGGHFSYPSSCCGSFYPSNLVRSTHIYSPRTCHLGSSLHGGCQEIQLQSNRCQTSAVHSPCQRSCYNPRVPRSFSPCKTTYAGSGVYGSSSCHSLGQGSRSSCSLGYGSRNFCSSSCGSRGFTRLRYGIQECPSTICGSRYCRPTYLASGNFQSSCYRPTCGSAFWRPTC